MMLTEVFLKDRLEALSSLDEQKIRAYCRKWGAEIPSHPEAFWGGIHKARCVLPGLPEAERELSRRWLRDHGFEVPG